MKSTDRKRPPDRGSQNADESHPWRAAHPIKGRHHFRNRIQGFRRRVQRLRHAPNSPRISSHHCCARTPIRFPPIILIELDRTGPTRRPIHPASSTADANSANANTAFSPVKAASQSESHPTRPSDSTPPLSPTRTDSPNPSTLTSEENTPTHHHRSQTKTRPYPKRPETLRPYVSGIVNLTDRNTPTGIVTRNVNARAVEIHQRQRRHPCRRHPSKPSPSHATPPTTFSMACPKRPSRWKSSTAAKCTEAFGPTNHDRPGSGRSPAFAPLAIT